jgi:hypothetical protein
MNHDPRRPESQHSRRWQPQFGLGGLMLVMLICSVMAAAGFYYSRALGGPREYQAGFILVTLIAPLLLAVILSSLQSLADWLKRP